MAIMDVLILLFTVFGLAYFQTPVIFWTLIVGLVLLLITLFGSLGFILLSIAWIFFLAAALFANLKKLRQQFVMTPLIRILQKRMPAISNTEREAIEAGNVWWEKDLFCGRPDWKKFFEIPAPKLSQEEQAFLDNQVETLCDMLNDWEIVAKENDLPKEIWDYIKKERFFGMVIPKEYGGRGFSALLHSSVVVKIATRSISAAVDTMVPNSLGPAELLLHYGTNEQKAYFLPRLARGEEIPCFALTSPEAGSDAGSMTDTGIVCYGEYEGKKVLGIRLNWDKRYITLAPVATLLGLAFKLYDPEQLLGRKTEELGITVCLIPTSHPGVETGNRHWPARLAFMNGPTRGKDVFVPIDWIIGGEKMAGQGWRMLMECLSIGRAISLPALGTACGKLSYRLTGGYARLRKQFNVAISQFEGIEEALAEMAGFTYILEACRIMTAGAVDQKIKPSVASAIAKYHMTEIARKIIAHAMDIHAGQAVQVGPRNLLAHAHMAIPISITVEGANILTRNLIIFGQGAIRCHPFILQEVELLSSGSDPHRVENLDKLLLSHIGYTVSNFARVLLGGLTGGHIFSAPVRGKTARYYRQLTRMSSVLAFLSDMAMMLLGGALKRKESISARLGDILSELYLGSAVLKYFHDRGEPESDLDYVRWSIEMCLYRAEKACRLLLNNFPMKWLGKILQWIIFPWGVAYQKPKDELSHKIVNAMLTPSDFRDRLTQYCYLGKEENNPLKRIEKALSQIQQIDPITKKFHIAIRSGVISQANNFEEQLQIALKKSVLTEEEVHAFREFEKLYQEIIKVDEFSFDLRTVL